MGRYRGAQCKRCRRAGVKLFLKSERCSSQKCAFQRRPAPPGPQHTTKRPTIKPSVYNLQLREKQKLKQIYGLSERQFKRYYTLSEQQSGLTTNNLGKLLERRLDNVVYRSGWAVTRTQARQMVNHGHILVNGKKVDIPSYLVKPEDRVCVREKFCKNIVLQNIRCDWLVRDSDFEVRILRTPIPSDINIRINLQLVISFCSK